jgi:hypothetical protein
VNVRQEAKIRAAALGFGVAVLLALGVFARSASADAPAEVPFVNAATAFSQAAQVDRAIDPEVFVRDSAAAPGTGPQRIEHGAGLRVARLDDEPQSPIFRADGVALDLSLGNWLAARGTVAVEAQPDGHDRVTAVFKNLIAFGDYSLFVAADSSNGVTAYRPLDGEGSANSFVAHVDGSAAIVIDTPAQLSSGNAIVLVYHSDSREHGASRGQIGVTAHEQLVARVP